MKYMSMGVLTIYNRLIRRFGHSLLVLILILNSTGCHSLQNEGAPDPSFDVDKDLAELAKQFGDATSITDYYKAPSVEARNKFVSARLVMMNIRYIQFVRKSTTDKQLLDSASEILVMSLSLAGAATGGTEAKTILAAVAAGISGSKVTLDKNFYYEKTIPALIAEMNAQRKTALVPILTGMRATLDDYPFEQAVTDLHAYYFAGTYLGAIQTIQSDAGGKENDAQKKIDRLTPISITDLVTKQSLTKAIGKLKDADLDKAKAVLKDLDPTAAVPANLDAAKTQLQDAVRKRAKTPQDIAKVAAAFKTAGISIEP